MSWIIEDNKDKKILSLNFLFYNFKRNIFKTTYKYTFLNLAKNIYNYIKKNKKILCNGKEALNVHTIVVNILLNAK